MRKSIVAGVAVTSAAVFALIAPGQAGAADTTATFAIAAGSLSITAPPTAELNATPAEPSDDVREVSGTISGMKVTDDRRGTSDWLVFVHSNGQYTYKNSAGELGTPFTATTYYTPRDTTVTGDITIETDGPGIIGRLDANGMGGRLVQRATAVHGANTAAWNADISVAIPENALAGTYTGLYTHDVY